jgi:hypothetical protein
MASTPARTEIIRMRASIQNSFFAGTPSARKA